MKKIFMILIMTFFVTGCGASKEELTNIFYDSIEKAYVGVYTTDGVGLPVLESEQITVDGKTWYKVASTKYTVMETLENAIDSVYSDSLAKGLKETLHQKYKEVDASLYTLSNGGCMLDYQLTDVLKENLKKDVKIKKITNSKAVFTYKNKEYTAKKDKDNYTFDKKVFECEV